MPIVNKRKDLLTAQGFNEDQLAQGVNDDQFAQDGQDESDTDARPPMPEPIAPEATMMPMANRLTPNAPPASTASTPGVHRKKMGLKDYLLTGLVGFAAGAGQPNVAHGGGTDVMRGGMAGAQAGMGIVNARRERENEDAKLAADLEYKKAQAKWENSRPDMQWYQQQLNAQKAAENARNHDLQHNDRQEATGVRRDLGFDRNNIASRKVDTGINASQVRNAISAFGQNRQAQQAGYAPNSVEDIQNGTAKLTPVTDTSQMTQAQRDAHTMSNARVDEANANTESTKKKTSLMDRAMALNEARTNMMVNGSAPDLDQEALDMVSDQYAMTGQIPTNLGRGTAGQALVRRIISNAAKRNPGTNLAFNRASYDSYKKTYGELTKTLTGMEAFKNAAEKNFVPLIELAKKIPDSGAPWVNQPMRLVNAQLLGDKEQYAFNLARSIAGREVERVVTDPAMKGALTVHAQQAAAELVRPDVTFNQLLAGLQVMTQDMDNVHSSYKEQWEDVGKKLRAGAPSGHPAASTRRDQPPQQQQFTVKVKGKEFKFSTQAAADDFAKKAGVK
jgi:hypothetical protein